VQAASSNTVGERAQDVEVVHSLQARGRDEVKGSRVLHALRVFDQAEAVGASRQAWRAEHQEERHLRHKRMAETARSAHNFQASDKRQNNSRAQRFVNLTEDGNRDRCHIAL